MPNAGESWASSPGRRRIMQAIQRRDTNPEMAVRRLLHSRGLRYRVDWSLPFDRRRKADIVFTKPRVAVFIDGCFWHGCPEHFRAPSTNDAYWSNKITVNTSRDRDTDSRLRESGWLVLRFWEHEDPSHVAADVEAIVRAGASPCLQAVECLCVHCRETHA